jgi:hypothetical protein
LLGYEDRARVGVSDISPQVAFYKIVDNNNSTLSPEKKYKMILKQL